LLAGDNAIVIALAARNLPKALQRRAIAWGTLGAVVVRSALTVAVLWILAGPRPDAGRRRRCWSGIAWRLLTGRRGRAASTTSRLR